MDVIYHKQIKKDLRAALAYYDAEGGRKLGDRFFDNVEAVAVKVVENPQAFHFVADGLRRAGLEFFPYHLIYESNEKRIYFLILRHNRRRPNFGLSRRGFG